MTAHPQKGHSTPLMPTINANPHVSNAVLKGLAAGKPNNISAAEWRSIKKTALSQIRTSGNPKATLATVRQSLVLANRAAQGALKNAIKEFVSGDLATAVKERVAQLKREPSVRNWSGYNTYRRGRS